MNGDAGLVGCLVERLTTRLPHRTGTPGQDLQRDDVAVITRATLVKISATSIAVVFESLVSLLEELGRPYKTLASHPPHILLSEVYVLSLAADCCCAHWNTLGKTGSNGTAGVSGSGPKDPEPLDDGLVTRTFELCKYLLDPLPEGYYLPAKTILDEKSAQEIFDARFGEPTPRATSSSGSDDSRETKAVKNDDAEDIEPYIKTIIEFVTASSWSASFEYVRNVIYGIRATTSAQVVPTLAMAEEEKTSLAVLRFISYIWVDAQKLGLVIQELCSSFLHFRRAYQNTVAVVTPLLITRWIERYPGEFVLLHHQHRKLDGGPDTLFDMTYTVSDSGKRRSTLYPFQISLLMLIPDVFEVASNLRDAKTGGMAKKVAFLETLRKALRNKNDAAGYCLISLLRAVRHFEDDGEAAIVSYAMDVQDEVRDAVFRRYHPNSDQSLFDQDLTTAAFISLTHLNFEGAVESLTQSCLNTSAPTTFKIAIIQACSYFARQPNAQDYRRLFTEAAGYIQSRLKAMSAISADLYIGDRHSQRKASETSSSTTMVICNILNFLDASPLTLFEAPPPDTSDAEQFYEEIFEAFVSCLVTANDSVRALASSLAKKLIAPNDIISSLRKSKRLDSNSFIIKFWRLTSLVLMEMCEKHEQQGDDAILKSIQGYLESRLLLLSSIQELSAVPEDIPELIATSTKLETLFLTSLCSADIETCQLVTSCIGLFHEECRILDSTVDAGKTANLLLRNGEIFSEIASPDFRFTGMMAFQKRIRALLRRTQYPSAGILDAWEKAFDKWLHLSKDVSTTSADSVDEKSFSEWRNLSGFLASLGGICTSEQAYILEEPAAGGLKWIDRLSSENHEEPLLNRYLQLSTQLLACTNVRVRETTREVLSIDISPTLYQSLFKALEAELEVLFTGALETSGKGQDVEIIFAEQAASLLKALVERLQTPSELGAASSVSFSSLGLSFAKFLDGVADNTASLRVKIKICQLCESVNRKKEHLNLRDDVRKRNQLLEYIFSWIARPRSPPSEGNYSRQDDTARVQRDLDKACLRCLAELTYRLPLQPGDGQNDAGTSELKSQMFRTYFNRFLSLLNYEPPDSIRGDISAATAHRDEAGSTSELAITILSNLLSANIDVGLKYSLSIGYNENVEIRTAFVKVLYNILVQGTEFSNLSDKAVNEKYDELLELLTHDMNLAVAISTVCPSSEVEELTISMLNIFESRGLSFELMEALIKQEIEETENESEILRRNCVATKMLSIYAKWKGAGYLKATLQKVVERLMLTSKDLDLELDPTRISSQEELQKNALQLRIVAKVFIDDICASSANIPASFRKICSIISTAVMPRFQEAKYTAVGAFIFLRFFCPAIVAPEAENLVDTPPSKEMRRGLLLIAKVIQNLANNVLFGAKEPYMYPLNDFLTQNIYRVTTFLREISVPPPALDTPSADSETFEFGSCVALHRFLYDHWDHVRQRLMSQERRDHVRSPNELARGRSPVLEPLRALITNLGPPPLAVTWNRPQISANTPLAYSRFQHFMLRNAFRSTDSFLTSRAIYDGGESRDGLSVICVILRHIDQDSIDYDTLLYCFLKIASRLWHKPFGLLIDATCYDGQNDPPDELFKQLELLSPSELSQQLSRIYVYNMNSTFRKCFRRVLRVATKSDASPLNPSNVEYLLLSSRLDLQAHFHLSQVHLPKETISIATDSRYTYQPVTRLSKTKGKIEVTVGVGGSFVQVTTVKKQEVHPSFRLSGIVNDIFHLKDLDEAPTAIPTEDDSAFGLRADNGKIVMYFQSARKTDLLKEIRRAKAMLGKDTRSAKPYERLIRPQDVPGTLLNLALTNLASPDAMLRIASYNLLGALCRAFKFKAASKFMCIKGKAPSKTPPSPSLIACADVSVPLDPTQFIINISKVLAQEEPQLTSDFLNEFFVGWESFSEEQKPLSLAYMAPWIPSLRTSLLPDESDSEKAKEKIATIFRKLVEVTVMEPSLALILEYTVWPAIYKDEVLLDIFLDEIVKAALAVGLYDEHTQALTSIVTAIGTITLRGKIISRLRKALNRSSLRPTKYLPDNAVWNEICILLQFCLSLSFDCGVQSQLYLPELFHIVTMLSNTGSYDIRALVHRLLINSIHAACTSFKLEDTRLSKLRATLEILSEPRNDSLSVPLALARDGTSITTSHEAGPSLSVIENLATLLFETCSIAAPSVDMANAWRSRWMSLVASTAFQNNPAIQPRAFTVMGCLAREEVDDDLLYQVLVALRNSVGRFGEDNGSDMLVAVVTALSKMIAKLTSASRYGPQLFWLAMSLIRLVPANLFNCAALFLEAVLANIGTISELRSKQMSQYLLQGRSQLEEATLALDDAYGVHFNAESFHFAVCACLARGLTDPITKAPALRVLSTFLEMTTDSSGDSKSFSSEFYASPYLALIQARAITPEDLKECLWSAGINPVSVANLGPARSLRDLDGVKDKDLLLNTAIELVDFQILDETVQTHTLKWLNELASGRPAVVLHLCPTIASFLDEVLLHGQSSSTLGSAHALLQTLSSNAKFTSALESSGMLSEILEDMGFEGLWRSSSFSHAQDPDKQCSILTEKLIELIII
ncbi:GTPase [Hypomontagnella submonticulosa]|nr:GTPase [Hypomontagnella submonticulosa]